MDEKIKEAVARKLAEVDRNPWWEKLSDLDKLSYLSDAEVIISAIRSELEKLPVLRIVQTGVHGDPRDDAWNEGAKAQKADILTRLGVESVPPSIGEVVKGSP